MSLFTRLRTLFLRDRGDLGLLRTASDVRARLRDLPKLACNDAPDGARGYFVGTVRALGDAVLAPVAGRACVFARVTRSYNASYNEPQELLSEFEVGSDFLLEDASGSAVVRTTLLSLLVRESSRVSLAYDTDIPEHLREHVARVDHSGASSFSQTARTVLYVERRLVVGEPLLVVGAARREHDPMQPNAGYRASGTRAVIEPAPDAMFLYAIEP